jgi:hypothetical protein
MRAVFTRTTRRWPLILAVVIAQLAWLQIVLFSGTRAMLHAAFPSHTQHSAASTADTEQPDQDSDNDQE